MRKHNNKIRINSQKAHDIEKIMKKHISVDKEECINPIKEAWEKGFMFAKLLYK